MNGHQSKDLWLLNMMLSLEDDYGLSPRQNMYPDSLKLREHWRREATGWRRGYELLSSKLGTDMGTTDSQYLYKLAQGP